MKYRPAALVSPKNVTLVSTFVASTFTPEMIAPLGSVTRPMSVAVGPAKTTLATRNTVMNRRSGRQVLWLALNNFSFMLEYAARIAFLYHRQCSQALSRDRETISRRYVLLKRA